VSVSSTILVKVFRAAASRIMDDGEMQTWTSMLQPPSDLLSPPEFLHIGIVADQQRRKELQTSVILSTILETLRAMNNVAKAKKLVNEIDTSLVSSDSILCSALRGELQTLVRIVNVEDCATDKLKELKQEKDKTLENTALKLQQALLRFPTGKDLCDLVDIEVTAASKDADTSQKLVQIQEDHTKLMKITDRVVIPASDQHPTFKPDFLQEYSKHLFRSWQCPSSNQTPHV
jgi:hypothetical protein